MLALLPIVLLCMRVAAEEECTTEITTAEEFYSLKSTFDLIFDVRTLNEYLGNGDEACNAAKADKCNLGHDPDMWMLTNPDRSDQAVIYKVDGSYVVDDKIVPALQSCYGAKASSMKIAVSCHSGGRSYKFQQALLAAGFSCGNMWNVKPGAAGLYAADPTKMVKEAGQKGPWSCDAAPPPPDPCTTEITTAAEFYSMKSTFDLIVDVRTLNEYLGNGDAACNAAKADKCNLGHDPDMWMLTNPDRSDQAVIYKVDGSYVVDDKIVDSLKSCYGAKASSMKIAVSCHSGGRSYKIQQALLAAGFSCGNMWNVKPGAAGLYAADPTKMVKGAGQKGPWSCDAAPPNAETSGSTFSVAFSLCSTVLSLLGIVFVIGQ